MNDRPPIGTMLAGDGPFTGTGDAPVSGFRATGTATSTEAATCTETIASTETTETTEATAPTETTETTEATASTEATAFTEVAAAPVEPRHRLHPVTPVLRGLRVLAVVIAIFSWQGYQELGPRRWALAAAGVLVAALTVAAVSWFTTGYQIHGRELRISEGLLWRRTRAIPLERLQTVDVVRPLLARLTGVAELRLEVVGAARAEAPLAYLSQPVAVRLREHLLSLAGGHGRVRPGERPADRLVYRGANSRVLLAQLLTPHTWFVPVALALAVLPYQHQQRWNLVAVGSLLTAVAGVVQVPVRRVVDDWHFRIREDAAGLRLHHGLLSTRSQTVPRQRIQAVGVTWPLMWRPLGWLRARMDVAGFSARDREANTHGGMLVPVADRATAYPVLAEVLGANLSAPPVTPAPRRARWLAPLRYRRLAAGHDRDLVYARDGWLVERLVIVPLARTQSVRVMQGPVQRLLRLADVHVDTAGRMHVVAEHRDAAEAYALAATLAESARAARAREMGAHHRSTSAATA
ncbi:PH domain-containing protein [Planosporangium sp. 12N6]|uniref:PH domain-containing protein n=1 Tax=Planosporangium spinosum TaxID=3402278 RepID=UPI003CE82A9C